MTIVLSLPLNLLLFLLLASCHSTQPVTAAATAAAHNVHESHVDNMDDTIDFPPKLDSDDIAYFAETYDLDGLHWALTNVFYRSERNPHRNDDMMRRGTVRFHPLPHDIVSRGGGSTYTTEYKLKLDLEQAEYLASHLQNNKDKAEFFRTVVAPIYRTVLNNIPPLETLQRTNGLYAFRPGDVDAGIQTVYNKAWHVTDFEELKDEHGNVLKLLNDAFDPERIQNQWFGENKKEEEEEETKKKDKDHADMDDNDNLNSYHPGVVIVDDILSPRALQRIRQILLESTVWYQTKMPLKFGGYAGAYIDDGLHDRILLQLAFELHQALPRIMSGHPLRYLWAYKYDSEYTGINTHADQAAVNVNLWVTPDDANLDRHSGGLVIFTAKPPSDWDFERYNTDAERAMRELIRPTNYANVTVPYRENRAVIFDSALFHHTDTFKFKKGYENRRINLTILYGDMKMGARNTGDDGVATNGRGGGGGGGVDTSAKEDL